MSLVPNLRRTRNQVSKSDCLSKNQNENILPPSKKTLGLQGIKQNAKDRSKPSFGVKRKADDEYFNALKVAKKRSAFGDITNAIEKSFMKNGKPEILKENTKPQVASSIPGVAPRKPLSKKLQKENCANVESGKTGAPLDFKLKNDSLEESIIVLSQELKINRITLEDSSSYITASEESPFIKKTPKKDLEPELPPGVEDFDKISINDPFSVSLYAMDIFNYYRLREKQFPVEKYLNNQKDISRSMRAILVDWMVEVQESFELNHETLYLAVKLVDLYLSKKTISREQLQLVGSTAIFIACKFDERTPPYIDDFLYICDDAYKRQELIDLEMEILRTLNYDLGIPLSYRFLRRYARCGKVNMETMTFARYILELSLMDYDLIEVQDSMLAAAALFLALVVKDKITSWSSTYQYYSGYALKDFYHFVQMLHQMLREPRNEHLKTITKKYSHKIFFEVAKIPIPESLPI